ncbi:hypothetical protein [Nocardioides sediminis]|uniref:hypothetical protein n=1 Tax=Nocardioides sediminis TaxID=433648 RepID=UPI000D307B1A|nr:hypothetical protein [Nocardioides sediminis]
MSAGGDDERRTREDAAWRDIVDNYGDRPELDEPPAAVVEGPIERPTEWRDEEPEPRVVEPVDEERFVPPPPPPLPRPAPRRALAWAGVFGVPIVILVSLVASLDLPSLLDYLLLAWFVGGFLYLVATMPRHPREPWDDGSRI